MLYSPCNCFRCAWLPKAAIGGNVTLAATVCVPPRGVPGHIDKEREILALRNESPDDLRKIIGRFARLLAHYLIEYMRAG